MLADFSYVFFVTLNIMATSLNINDILSQVKKLEKEDQLTLLQELANLLKREETEKTRAARLTSLAGMGSAIWKMVWMKLTNILMQKENGNTGSCFKNSFPRHRDVDLFHRGK